MIDLSTNKFKLSASPSSHQQTGTCQSLTGLVWPVPRNMFDQVSFVVLFTCGKVKAVGCLFL